MKKKKKIYELVTDSKEWMTKAVLLASDSEMFLLKSISIKKDVT